MRNTVSNYASNQMAIKHRGQALTSVSTAMQGSNIYSVLLDFTEKTNIDVLVLGMPNDACLCADNTNCTCYQMHEGSCFGSHQPCLN